MRQILYIPVIFFGLSACANISPHEAMVTIDNAIGAAAENAENFYDEGIIDKREACYVLVAAESASVAADAGWRAIMVADWDDVSVYIDQARAALQGATEAVRNAQETKCEDLV